VISGFHCGIVEAFGFPGFYVALNCVAKHPRRKECTLRTHVLGK